MLPLLLACTCPSFDAMDVEDVDGTASEEALDAARDALSSFAAWTGDEGVCVPGIELREDLPEPLFLDADYAVGGQYRGPRKAIRVSTQEFHDVGTSTMHELCHALDHLEEHRDALEWPSAADPEVYGDAAARKEDFAIACQGGPVDVTADVALVERCGSERLYDDADRYLAEVVFPGGPRVDLAEEPAPLTAEERAWGALTPGADLLAAAPWDGGVALLVLEPDAGEGRELVLRVMEADLETVRSEVTLAEGLELASVTVIPTDAGLILDQMLVWWGEAWFGQELVVPTTGARTPVSLGSLYTAVASSGTVYALDSTWSVTARTLDGEEVDVTQPPPLLSPLGLWTLPGGVGVVDLASLHLYDATADTWTSEALPRRATAFADLGDGRLIVLSGAVRFLYEDGAWAFAGDPCTDVGGDAWYVDDLVPVGDGIVAFPLGQDVGERTVTVFSR